MKGQIGWCYPHTIFEERGAAGGIAIISKFKLSNMKIIESEDGWFPALLAEVHAPVGLVQLLNVHLRPPLSERGSASLSAVYVISEVHKKEMRGFLNKTEAGKPLIIAGDFNEDEYGGAVQSLKELGFVDALSIYDRQSETWRWNVGIFVLKNRYDHILFSKDFDCTGARVNSVKASDHMPVLAVIVNRDENMGM